MEKRYQVFVSSTFADLKDERQEVLRAILELDHMPAGMELFPATDDSAWQLIQDVIDASDYYIVIIGGRYGSVDEKGLGFTEREYDYAVTRDKPVIALLHRNPGDISRDKTDKDDAGWKKLEAFRAKVEKQHSCNYWKTPEELKSKAIISLTQTTKRNPCVGWVRADRIPSQSTLADILGLRTRIAELEQQLASDPSKPPEGTEDLVQGDEKFRVDFEFKARSPNYPVDKDEGFDAWVRPTWNEIFAAVAPMMINEAADAEVRRGIHGFFLARSKSEFQNDKDLKRRQLIEFKFRAAQIETVIVQFRALRLIEASVKPRSVKDTSTYWRLTKHGDDLMTKLRAIRRRRRPVGENESEKETKEDPRGPR
jgi:hypothetical protein